MGILYYPNRLLTTPTKDLVPHLGIPILPVGLKDELLLTAVERRAVGLAANQIGGDSSVVLLSLPGETSRLLINPRVVEKSKQTRFAEEACLSLPGITVTILRHDWVVVKYRNEQDSEVEETFKGFAARVAEHEIDHLNGLLIFHHVPLVTRHQLLAKMRKAKRVERASLRLVEKMGVRR